MFMLQKHQRMPVAEEEEGNHWRKTSYLQVKIGNVYITAQMNKAVQLSNFLLHEMPVCRLTLRRRRT